MFDLGVLILALIFMIIYRIVMDMLIIQNSNIHWRVHETKFCFDKLGGWMNMIF